MEVAEPKKNQVEYVQLRTRRVSKNTTIPCRVRRYGSFDKSRNSANKIARDGSGLDGQEELGMGKRTSGIKPVEEEIEEFLAAAERAETKRFTDKYNFDFAKEMPLEVEGRYEWVQI